MSAGFAIESEQLRQLQSRLEKIGAVRYTKLANGIGAVVESQTRRRIKDEKKDPKGGEWKDWSEKYAASKHGAKAHKKHPGQLRSAGSHSLLFLSGAMHDSIQFNADLLTGAVEVGSNLKYANRQNKAREFLGLSSSNEHELLNTIETFLNRSFASLL